MSSLPQVQASPGCCKILSDAAASGMHSLARGGKAVGGCLLNLGTKIHSFVAPILARIGALFAGLIGSLVALSKEAKIALVVTSLLSIVATSLYHKYVGKATPPPTTDPNGKPENAPKV